MTTPIAVDVTSKAVGEGIVANDAHDLAGITYRQLDHWARQDWVRPSLDQGRGRAGRRLYSAADVVRLDLLRHLAMSKVNTAQAGPRVADVEVPDDDSLMLWGPVGGKDGDAHLRVVERAEAVDFLADGGAWVVFDPEPVRARIARVVAPAVPETLSVVAPSTKKRRSA